MGRGEPSHCGFDQAGLSHAVVARHSRTDYNPHNPQGGAWLSLVERLLWEQDVGGSNPLAPTTSRSITSSRSILSRREIDGTGAHL